MLGLNLNLDPDSIDENDSTELQGTITGLLPNTANSTKIKIDFGNSSTPTELIVSSDAQGQATFTQSFTYPDDGNSPGNGTASDTYNIKVDVEQETLLIGTDAVFVIDVSGSTLNRFGGSPVGNQNNDSASNTILDAEIAAFKALNQELIDRGLGNISKVSIVQFSTNAFQIDMNPAVAGLQLSTTPLADADSNGVRDVDQALNSLLAQGNTNFEAGLQQAISTLQSVNTPPGKGNVIFLSDGFPSIGNSYTDEVNQIRNSLGQNLRAFGVGGSSSLQALQVIDSAAVKFTTTDELLNVFSGAGQAGGGTVSDSINLTVNNVAPNNIVLNVDSVINENGTVTLSGTFDDPGNLDRHTVKIDWADPNSTTPTELELNLGDRSFSATHTYTDDGVSPGNGTPFDISNIQVTVEDDDTGKGTANSDVKVSNLPPELNNLTTSTSVIVAGDSLNLNAAFSDVGSADQHQAQVDWGNGDTTPGIVDQANQTISAQYTYNTPGLFNVNLTVSDDDGGSDTQTSQVKVAQKVDIDWKPGSNPSSMNFKGGGVVPVALLTTSNFDATKIVAGSLRADDQKDILLNGGGIVPNKTNFDDVDKDGDQDLVVFFKKADLISAIASNATNIFIYGTTLDPNVQGGLFLGSQMAGDPLKIVG